MTDVVFWLPAINPYWNTRFKALHEDGRVNFICWFNNHLDPTRSWVVEKDDMPYPHRFLPSSNRKWITALVKEYRKARAARIFTFHFDPKLWPVWVHRLLGKHVALYCLMTWDSWVARSKLKEKAKRLFFTAASSTLTPGPDSDKWARGYGARHLFRLHHAVDVSLLGAASSRRSISKRLRLLYIGRLVPEKGIALLQSIIERLDGAGVEVDLSIIGDGRLRDELEDWSKGSWSNVAITVSGFVQTEQVPAVYAQTDLLLFTTLGDPYGLVVDEALAAGVPVISTDRAGDIHWRLAEGRGWVLSPDEPSAWADLIAHLGAHREEIAAASEAGLRYSDGHDVSRWVEEIATWVTSTEMNRK